ncbi:MAG: hypothetical protein B6A08_20305 [Sorangiineae bacterium NIC37A_2]|nr:MAG: hypothetical protein B6A08_20305 [Sorangiineae bacterium NIC37A_2]
MKLDIPSATQHLTRPGKGALSDEERGENDSYDCDCIWFFHLFPLFLLWFSPALGALPGGWIDEWLVCV